MSQTHNTNRADREIQKAQQRIKEQKVRLRRTIVQGCPSADAASAADAPLSDMERMLLARLSR